MDVLPSSIRFYPGKDVDVFLRFTRQDTSAEPRAVFNAVWRVIVRKYGQYGSRSSTACWLST